MKRLALFNTLGVLAALLLPGCNSAKPETIVPVLGITPTTAPEVTAARVTSTIEAGMWKTYQNPQAGYSAEYPADWIVSEQISEGDTLVTTFSSTNGNAGIVVMVQRIEFDGTGNSDIPNTRCGEVKVGDLTGMQCFDTINAATSTTVAANGKTFTIAALGKHLDENLYSRFLSGLQIRQ
jgi:hypothetical protein